MSTYLSLGKKAGRIPELDGLRALAIIMVLLHHFDLIYGEIYSTYYRHALPSVVKNLMANGWMGVDLFFVLSGYLIFRHLLKQQPRQPDIPVFFLKRVLRTFPLYYAIIVLITTGLLPGHNQELSIEELLKHVFFWQDYARSEILIPLWSLATEEKFYLIAPLLAWAISRWRHRSALTVMGLLIVALIVIRLLSLSSEPEPLNYTHFFFQYRAPFHFAIVGILIGAWVAMVTTTSQVRPPIWLVVCSLILTLGLLLWTDSTRELTGTYIQHLHNLILFNFGLWVWAAVTHTGQRWLSVMTGRTLRIIAILSYALYLVHYPMVYWTLKLHKSLISSEVAWVHMSTFLLLYLLLSLLFSLVLHYLIEKPFLLIKDRLG